MYRRLKSNRLIFAAALLLLLLGACSTVSRGMSESVSSDEAIFFSGSSDVSMPAAMAIDSFDTASDEDMSLQFSGGDGNGFAEEQMARNEERIVIKNGDLTIAVEDPAKSMDEISKMAEEMGGFVVSSNLYQTHLENGQEVPQGNVTIRVPSERFLEVLETIEGSANQVLSRNQSGQDVTREYTDMNSRLVNLENTEAQLREIMASATKTEDVLRVYNELSRIRGEIEMVKGQIQYFEQAAALSAISVTLVADEAVQPLTIGGWQPAGVAKEAIQSLINTLQALANSVIWLILFLLPILIVLAIPLWLIWRAIKRRKYASETSLQKDKSSK